MLNDGVVVGAAAARIGRHLVILAVKTTVAHGLRAAKGRASHVGHHSKLAHGANVAIAAVQRKPLCADAGHGIQARVPPSHGLALQCCNGHSFYCKVMCVCVCVCVIFVYYHYKNIIR